MRVRRLHAHPDIEPADLPRLAEVETDKNARGCRTSFWPSRSSGIGIASSRSALTMGRRR